MYTRNHSQKEPHPYGRRHGGAVRLFLSTRQSGPDQRQVCRGDRHWGALGMKITYKLREATDHLPSLQVGLSIQVSSLDVAQPIRVTGGQQQNVRRYDLIAVKTDKVAHSDLFPVSNHILLFFPGKRF